jgi:hypothetical protein
MRRIFKLNLLKPIFWEKSGLLMINSLGYRLNGKKREFNHYLYSDSERLIK